jgi:sulfite reductase beta subunit-like hemoprotein
MDRAGDFFGFVTQRNMKENRLKTILDRISAVFIRRRREGRPVAHLLKRYGRIARAYLEEKS